MISRTVTYEGDGLTLTGRMAIPDGTGPFPGVLIGHEGPGLDPLQLARADELAELGYVGFALDYHGPHAPFADRSHMMARLDELTSDPDRTRTLATAALDVLTAEPTVDASRVGAIGYCFGATLALELARSGADLKAIVGFHPGLTNVRPGDSANIRGSVLMIVGSEDPLIGLDERVAFEREMRAAGVDWQLHLLGGAEHSFTHPGVTDAAIPGLAYHPVAAERAKRSMLDLFGEVF